MKYTSMYERLIANSEKPDDQNENGCWLWTGRTDGKRWPYGRMNVWRNGKVTTVAPHREMEQRFHDEPLCPETQTIEHLCGNTLCVNPDHLTTMSRVENSKLSQQRNPRGFK